MNRIVAVIFMGLFMLSACGQKGPLYLPQPNELAEQVTSH